MFAQLVVGPPGTGKTTYCQAIRQALNHLERKTIIVNLDPANDIGPDYCHVDISTLIRLQDAMDEFGLGPNGALNYCLDYLASNLDWLHGKLHDHKDSYVLFDFPGQAEIYSHHSAITIVIQSLQKLGYQLCVVQLMDSHQCLDIHKYVCAALLALQSMMHLELPQVNVLSKIDIVHAHGTLGHRLSTFTHPDQDLIALIDSSCRSDPGMARYKRLSSALAELVTDYSLVDYVPFCATDPMCLQAIITLVDKASGYVYGPVAGDISVAGAIQAVIDKYDRSRNMDGLDRPHHESSQVDRFSPPSDSDDDFGMLEQLQHGVFEKNVLDHQS